MRPVVTIAIPTFNRAAKLKAQLDRLMPQLTDEACCCVFDNASTDETLRVVQELGRDKILYSRSRQNYGLSHNFFRCFEECQTEWLWVLSDDDPISSRAVADVLKLVRGQPVDFIHTSAGLCMHDSQAVISDIGELLQRASLGSLFFISAGIYRMPSFRPFLHSFIASLSTWVPQTVMLLNLLEAKGGAVLLSPTNLVVANPEPPRFSTLEFIIRLNLMPEYLKRAEHQKLVAGRIWLELVHWALLTGLREIEEPVQIRKWRRIRWQVQKVLRAYGAPSPWVYIAENWFRFGHRRESLLRAKYALSVAILGYLPKAFFTLLLRIPPWRNWARGASGDTVGKYGHTNY